MPRCVVFSESISQEITEAFLMSQKFRLTHQNAGAKRSGVIESGDRRNLQRVADSLNKRFPNRKYKVEPSPMTAQLAETAK